MGEQHWQGFPQRQLGRDAGCPSGMDGNERGVNRVPRHRTSSSVIDVLTHLLPHLGQATPLMGMINPPRTPSLCSGRGHGARQFVATSKGAPRELSCISWAAYRLRCDV
eukprot:930446-Pelagomonas_calceolata.AAC.2